MKVTLLPLLLLTLLCTSVRAQKIFPTPVNDIVPERTNMQRRALPQPPLREADILWQKRVWRVIDVREKINHHFTTPQAPLISLLLEAAEEERIQLYSTTDDRFTTPLTSGEMAAIRGGIDTVEVIDPITQTISYEPVARSFNPATVTRYRLKEVWYIDKNSSQMKVRLLGIAPIIDEVDEMGAVRFERPLFWAYYPAARTALAGERAYVSGNEASARSWEDVFESRQFASYVMKEGNVHDRRIQDYVTDGRTRLRTGEALEQERLGRESDLWSY